MQFIIDIDEIVYNTYNFCFLLLRSENAVQAIKYYNILLL